MISFYEPPPTFPKKTLVLPPLPDYPFVLPCHRVPNGKKVICTYCSSYVPFTLHVPDVRFFIRSYLSLYEMLKTLRGKASPNFHKLFYKRGELFLYDFSGPPPCLEKHLFDHGDVTGYDFPIKTESYINEWKKWVASLSPEELRTELARHRDDWDLLSLNSFYITIVAQWRGEWATKLFKILLLSILPPNRRKFDIEMLKNHFYDLDLRVLERDL
jgi:hypothetical protein